jgi:hypothetical protein
VNLAAAAAAAQCAAIADKMLAPAPQQLSKHKAHRMDRLTVNLAAAAAAAQLAACAGKLFAPAAQLLSKP